MSQNGTSTYSIGEFAEIRVRDEDDDATRDRSIRDITLIEVTDRYVSVNITFSDLNALTIDVKDPDFLDVQLTLPELIIDAETYERIADDQLNHEAMIVPQMTTQSYAELVELVKAYSAAGLSYCILELIVCFSLNKSLTSMWILVNTSQFLAFISMWLIQLPTYTRLMLNEFRRIYLGEFIDDLEFGQ